MRIGLERPALQFLGRGHRLLRALHRSRLAEPLNAVLVLGLCGVRLLLGEHGEPLDVFAVRRSRGNEIPVTGWKLKKCGCVKARLPRAGKVAICCDRHRGKPTKKRLLCHFEEGRVCRG